MCHISCLCAPFSTDPKSYEYTHKIEKNRKLTLLFGRREKSIEQIMMFRHIKYALVHTLCMYVYAFKHKHKQFKIKPLRHNAIHEVAFKIAWNSISLCPPFGVMQKENAFLSEP